jgi:Fe-S oxidoreductase
MKWPSRFKAEASPLPAPRASRDFQPPPGREADQRLCGLPASLLPDWQEAFLAAFRKGLKRYSSLRHHLESCVRCGACAPACPYYQGTADPLNIPAARANLARQVYERFLAPGGLRLPASELSLELIENWRIYYHQCSLCRRCALFCPLGLDTSEVTFACREILAAIGISSQAGSGGAAEIYRTGNHRSIMPSSWNQRHRVLEEELERETGQSIACPVDEYGAEVLFLPPAQDLVRHRATYKAYAKLFHAAGVSWTVSTYIDDASNPGAWLDFRNMRLVQTRVLEAARELTPQLIIWGESGIGWRVAARFAASIGQDWDGEDYLNYKAPLNIVEWAYHLYQRGAFSGKLQPEANRGRVVTYHDPCQAARSCNLVIEPRRLLNAVCNWHEMPAGTTGRETLCCGGGGGIGQANPELALAGFLPRARVLAHMNKAHGCNLVATICDGCRTALARGSRHYKLGMSVGGVVELMGNALYPNDPIFDRVGEAEACAAV